MIPCSSCHRHIRASELACPFCAAALRSTDARTPLLAMAIVGAFALVGCASDPPTSDGDEAGTGTGPGTSDESDTIVDESTDESTDESDTSTTTTSSTSNGDTVDDGWDDNGGSFYAGPDTDTTTGEPFECDPFAQDCPEGEKCVPFASLGVEYDHNKCVPVLGDGKPGDPCTSQGPATATDDCDETSVCWLLSEVEGEFVGQCLSFCTGSPDAPICEGESQCEIGNEGSVAVCVPP